MNTKRKSIIAIIPARGGSKAIPNKNIINFCSKPLLAWTIEQAFKSKYIDDVYVTTDSNLIKEVSRKYGAKVIYRPKKLATAKSSSEKALVHAIKKIENFVPIDIVVFLQATSPLRENQDIDNAIKLFILNKADSLFSATVLEDFCTWELSNGRPQSITYDYKNRGFAVFN
jgi:N-acylneuraminate cytidylyltransferase